jgi:hypothetical protein
MKCLLSLIVLFVLIENDDNIQCQVLILARALAQNSKHADPTQSRIRSWRLSSGFNCRMFFADALNSRILSACFATTTSSLRVIVMLSTRRRARTSRGN